MPESNTQCQPNLRRTDASPVINRSFRRSSLLCAECHKYFRTAEELYMHSEVCMIESFENEAVSVFSGMPSLTDVTTITCTTQSGITVKGDSPPKLLPETADVAGTPEIPILNKQKKEKPGKTNLESAIAAEGSKLTSISSLKIEPKQHYRLLSERPTKKPFDPENARLLKGSKGLKLYVSIEKDSRSENENFESNYGGLNYECERTQSFGIANTKGKIIGALTNADDENLNRPKMECPTCGLVLYRHNFSTHYRIHTGELPFLCSYCQKRFRTTSALKVHIRAHTGEKPYSCPKCPYSCITKRNLDRHVVNNHVREGERRGPRERRSRYRRGEYTVMIDDVGMSIDEDAGSDEKIDHHYVIPEDIDNAANTVKESTDEIIMERNDVNEQSADLTAVPVLS